MKGIYALIIWAEKQKTIKIGKLGKIKFPKGFYAYLGSAQNSLEKRIARHFLRNKKLRWHIDYLLSHAKIKEAWIKENAKRSEECRTAKIFAKILEPIAKFGASDCPCNSHLLYSKNKKEIEKVLKKLGFRKISQRDLAIL